MIDAVVIGAGHAGLAVSACLARDGVEHLVLERGRVGETWRSQRWDSFTLNTGAWMNRLPGEATRGDPGAFWARDEVVRWLDGYAAQTRLPVETGVEVRSVSRRSGGFRVDAAGETVAARSVVVAAGLQRSPYVPPSAAALPGRIAQLHSSAYRNPGALREGAVVVVGAAQSACQIAEDLLEGGRRVYLCTSRVPRMRRFYRGRDLLAWLDDTAFYDQTVGDLPEPSAQFQPQAQISGTRGGHTVSLQSLARAGVSLLGRLRGVDGARLLLADDLAENVRAADEASARFLARVDEHIERHGLDAPPREADPADDPAPEVEATAAPVELDLDAAGVSSVVWCTGFRPDLPCLEADALDDRGAPRHVDGVAPHDGLIPLGVPWMRNRASGIIFGAARDGERAAALVRRRAEAP